MRELPVEQIHQQILCAREEERKQVARDLHDQIIQALVGLNYHISEIKKYRDMDMDSHIADIQSDLRAVIDDVRRICANLRPPALDSLGLIAAMRSSIREFNRQSNGRITFSFQGDSACRPDEAIELCIYRVFQEALTNAYKHADAQHIIVQLTIDSEFVVLDVKDDGKGFCVPESLDQFLFDKHFGLVGIRERLDMIDGRVEISSTPGCGTNLRAMVPLRSFERVC